MYLERSRKYTSVIQFYLTCGSIGIITGLGLLFAQDKKNIEIVDSLVIRIWEEVGERFPPVYGDTLLFVLSGDAERYQEYLAIQTENFFKSEHFNIFRNYDPTFSFQGLILEVDRFDPVITYSMPYRKKILGREYVQRAVILEVKGQVRAVPYGAIIDTLHMIKKYEDEVEDRQLDKLETSGYAFTMGKRSGYSLWQSVLEPVIAVTTVSVLVYLFFTQRS